MQNRTLFAAVLASAIALPAAAQDILPTPSRGVWLESGYTSFDFGAGDLVSVDFPSTVTFLSGRLPLGERTRLVVDLPFSYSNVESLGESETSSVFGNPYLGLEIVSSPEFTVEIGTRLPLTSADEESSADVFAAMANPLRGEAWAIDLIPVSLAANFSDDVASNVSVRTRIGTTVFHYTGDEEDVDTEAAIDYGVATTYTTGNARFGAGLNGRWLVTADEGGLEENTLHTLGLSADVLLRGIRPGLAVRLPLDEDYRDVVKSTIAVTLQVPLQ